MTSKKRIITVLGIIWIVIVVIEYFFSLKISAHCNSIFPFCINFSIIEYHAQYWRSLYSIIEPTYSTAGNKIFKISPFLSILLIISSIWSLAVLSIKRFWADNQKISISYFHIVLFFLCIELVVLFGWSGYLGVEITSSLPQILLHFFETIFKILIFVLTTVTIGNGVGVFLCRNAKYYPKLSRPFLLLISFCLGVSSIYFIAYLLALFGILNFKSVFLFLTISLLLFHKQFIFWFKIFFSKSISLIPPTSFFDLKFLSFILLLIFIARNFLQLSSPVPIGFDESTQYMNTVNLITENGRLVSGIPAFPWELYVSTAAILFKSISFARYVTFASGIFLLLAIFSLSKFYLEKRQLLKGHEKYYSLLVTLIFYSLPMVMFHSSRDAKVDIPSLLFSVTALCLFWKWIFSNRFKKDIYLLLLSFFFLGFGFAAKYTTLFFCTGIFISFAYFFYIKEMQTLSKKILISLLIFFCFISTITPFVLKSSFESNTFSLFSQNNNFSEFNKYLEKQREKTEENITISMLLDNAGMDVGRFVGSGDLKSKLLMPFIATNNSNVQGNYVDIGFIFLALVPLLILFYSTIRKNFPENFFLLNQLLIIFFVTYLLWLWKGLAIIWYGMAIFPLMLLLILEVKNYINKMRILKFMVSLLIICWLILVFSKTRTLSLGEDTQNNLTVIPPNIEYLKGTADRETFLEYYHKGKSEEAKVVNSEKFTKSKVYLIDPFLKYYIKENDRRCYTDQYLIIFNYLSENQGAEKAIKNLKKNGFELIVYDYFSINNFINSPELDGINGSLWRFLRNNPDKIELIKDDPLNGIIVGKIL